MKEKDLLRVYMELEKESIQRDTGAQNKLGISNQQLRDHVSELLKRQDKVLVSAVVRAVAQLHGVKPELLNQLRVRLVGVAKAKSSPFVYTKEDGRAWLVPRGNEKTQGGDKQ